MIGHTLPINYLIKLCDRVGTFDGSGQKEVGQEETLHSRNLERSQHSLVIHYLI